MEKRQLIGIDLGAQRGLMHQTADGIMSHQQSIKLLLHQGRSLAAQDHMGAAQMRFEFGQGSFNFPALVIQRSQSAAGACSGSCSVVISR